MDKEIMGIIFMFIAVLCGAGLIGNMYGSYQCNNYKEMTGKDTVYKYFDTCYIETPAGFMRWDEYKMSIVAKTGLTVVNKK